MVALTRMVVVGCCCAVAALGCSRAEGPEETPRSDFEALKANFPLMLDSNFTEAEIAAEVERILGTARAEPWGSGGNILEAAIAHSLDDRFGLYLLEWEYDRILAGDGAEAAQTFLDRYAGEGSDTAVVRKATYLGLDLLARESPERFMARCAELIADPSRPALRKFALYRRYDQHASSFQRKPAARDALQFWAEYPDDVSEMGAERAFLRAFREAGWQLEACGLEVSTTKGATAAALYAPFAALGAADFESSDEARTERAPGEIYAIHAPSAKEILARVSVDSLPPYERVAMEFRLAAIAADQSVYTEAAGLLRESAASLGGLAGKGDGGEVELEGLQSTVELGKGVLGAFAKLVYRDEGAISRNRLAPTLSESFGLASGFAEAWAAAARLECDMAGAKDAAAYWAVSDQVATFYDAIGDNQRLIETLSQYAEAWPGGEATPGAMLRVGDLYREDLNAPEEAIATYAALAEAHPDAPEAHTATLKRVLALYELNRYDDGLLALDEYLAGTPRENLMPSAQLLGVIAEIQLGLHDEAHRRAMALIAAYPASSAAPKALYELVVANVSRQQYEEALTLASTLLERYPESDDAGRTKELRERLSAMEQK